MASLTRVLKRTLAVAALLVAAYAGFRWGPMVFPPLERALGLGGDGGAAGVTEIPTPEIADATLELFESFRRGEGDRLALGSNQLTSVIRYAVPGLLPPGVVDPTIRLTGSRVRVSGRVAVGAFPALPGQLDPIVGLLPDTALVELEGSLVPNDQRYLSLLVDRVEASRVPLPRRMVGGVLEGLGRETRPGLPADALPVPLPDGIQAAYVQGDSLILVAQR